MHALKTLVAAVAASLTLGACAAGSSSSSALRVPDGPRALRLADGADAGRNASRSGEAPTMLKVTNYNWMDVVVYAVRGTARTRLGQVSSMNSATFRVPVGMVGGMSGVRLMVDPIGSTEGYQTENLNLHAGQLVEFNVQNALRLSSVMVGGD
jgi:hypothetical protein